MKIEIVTIGDELLIGQVIDTNSAWIGQHLNEAGFEVSRINSISDSEEEILNVLAESSSRCNVVLITGGLGPTKDDITKTTLCKYFDTKLVHNADVFHDVKRFLKGRVASLNDFNKQQALVPENCEVIRNAVGTAPIMWFDYKNTIYVSMPGVPSEMKHVMNNSIIPRLKTKFGGAAIVHKTILVHSIPEAVLAEMLEDWECALPSSISLAYLPAPGRIRLRLSARGEDEGVLQNSIQEQIDKLIPIIGDSILAFSDESVASILAKLFTDKKLSLATAESCTGGNIAHQITSIPGSSAFFVGSVVAYSNAVKQNVLGVNFLDINNYGAVSEPVVEQMAQGVRLSLGADYAVATSGIAGPDGGSDEKPVGTVWIAVCDSNKTISRCFNFGTIRERNIERASDMALVMLKELVG